MNVMRCVSMAVVVLLAGCASVPFGPASERTLATLTPMPLAAQLGDSFVLELESRQLAGVFDAVWARSDQQLRVQLFPDIGGKVLDVTARDGRLHAVTPDGDYEAVLADGDPEPHLALVVAAVLAELAQPLTADRVLGERRGGDGRTEVRLVPALGGGTVRATLAADGSVAGYRFAFGWLSFGLDGTGAFAGRGFSGRVCP